MTVNTWHPRCSAHHPPHGATQWRRTNTDPYRGPSTTAGNGRGSPKAAGEQTDYGDYVILILDHLAATSDSVRPINLDELIPRWQRRMQTWRAWMCTMTKTTLQQVGTSWFDAG